MKYIGIFVNRERDRSLEATKKTVQALSERGKTILLEKEYQSELNIDAEFVSHSEMLERAEMIIALGGDGTILKIINDAAEHNIPVLGINLGHLGFLTQAERDDGEIFDKIVNGDYTVTTPMMLEAKVCRDGSDGVCHRALNDIILRGSGTKMISLQVEVDGIVTNRYLADGIIVSTATGSTAYSLSCGGPIVHQSLDCMILTPICPHTLKSRCIIIPPNSSVVLKFDPAYCAETELKADGNLVGHLAEGDYIQIVKAEKRAALAILNDRNYFDVIRKKLSD